jgi:hypothetical protein
MTAEAARVSQKNQALVQADLDVFVVSQSKKAYLIGSRQEPAPIRITLTKEDLKWRVLSVNGFKLAITEF